ncbi:uncharacterized protein LOC134675653 [Cydia fagiglandana]|uniref:uncharacterized protein LOC134675653 n=1 Tax=Cydia fagiglandana TaxID=1458189 RepID=UPI002FEE261D
MSRRRRHEETGEEQWARLMEDYERMFQEDRRPKRRRILYSSSSSEDENVPPEEIVTEHLSPTKVDPEVLEETNPVVLPDTEEVTDNYDPDLLKALGETESEQGEFGVDLQPDIASRFQQILANGLKKEAREELVKKYLFPSNVPLAKAPTLNPEVAAMLVEICRLRDKRLYGKQDQLGRALSAVGKALTCLLKKNPDITEVISTLNDAGKLIADSHYAETDTRRSVIIPLVDKSLIESFKDRKRDSFLFGDKLGDLVNTSKGIKKTSQFIQASTSANAGLNSTGPPPYRPRQQRARQYYPRRVGGPPTTYLPHQLANRRREPPMRAPGRRYPPPPPPPPPPRARRHPPQTHRSTYRDHREYRDRNY